MGTHSSATTADYATVPKSPSRVIWVIWVIGGRSQRGEEFISDGHDRERAPIAVHLEPDHLPATCRRTTV